MAAAPRFSPIRAQVAGQRAGYQGGQRREAGGVAVGSSEEVLDPVGDAVVVLGERLAGGAVFRLPRGKAGGGRGEVDHQVIAHEPRRVGNPARRQIDRGRRDAGPEAAGGGDQRVIAGTNPIR